MKNLFDITASILEEMASQTYQSPPATCKYRSYTRDNTNFIEVEVPGFTADDLKLSTQDGFIYLVGNRKSGTQDISFEMKWDALGGDVNDISSSLKNGLLTIRVPFHPTEIRQIAISVDN